ADGLEPVALGELGRGDAVERRRRRGRDAHATPSTGVARRMAVVDCTEPGYRSGRGLGTRRPRSRQVLRPRQTGTGAGDTLGAPPPDAARHRGESVARPRDAVRSLVDRVRRPRHPARTALAPAARAERPLLSVVIPAYDVEPYLDEALTSLRAQTLT